MKLMMLLSSALVWLSASLPAAAQSLTPEERKVWDAFQEARELSDLKAMEKIAQRNKSEMESIFRAFSWQLSYNDSVGMWEDMKAVGRSLDETTGSNYCKITEKIIQKLSLEDRQKRADYYNQYDESRSAIQLAVKNKDNDAINATMPKLQELAQKFQLLGDPVSQGYCLVEMAKALEVNDQQVEAVKLYDQIDKALTAEGFQNFPFHGQVRSSRDSLIAAGYDPDMKPGEKPETPAGNTATSWADDPAGQAWSERVPMRVVVDEKITNFVTPNPANTINTFRWRSYQVNGAKPLPFTDDFQPMGVPFNVRKDGLKIFIDDGTGEREIKVISKPNVVEMEKEYKDWDGNAQKQEYAWFAACGGEESIFGFDVNFAPNVDGPMNVRYLPACYLKGKVLGQDLVIFDDNSSGKFGDPKPVRDGLTTWAPTFMYNDAMMFGKQKVAGPWTEFLEVDGEFYRLKLDPESYEVTTRKLSVDTGTVKLDAQKLKPSIVIIEEIGELKGAFFVLDPKKPITVPVGRYKLSYGVVRKGSGKNENTCEIFPPESGSFEVKKGEEAVLEIGAPFTFDFELKAVGEGVQIVGKSVVVRGRAGEMYTRFFDDPPIPEKVSVKGAGKPVKMERAVFEDFKQDGAAPWFPLDLVVPAKAGREYEVELELKKHELFGSKIETPEPKKIKL